MMRSRISVLQRVAAGGSSLWRSPKVITNLRDFRPATSTPNLSNREKFRNYLNKIAEEHQYKGYDVSITPFTSDNINYTSELFLAKISDSNKPDLNLFAKVAALGEKMRKQAMSIVFKNEIFFFTKLVKEYEILQDEYNVSEKYRIKTPKVYGCKPTYLEETIVLEDLVAAGYKPFDRFETVNWQAAAAAVEQLANLHAVSIAYREENPKDFDEFRNQRNNEDFTKGFISVIEKSSAMAVDATKDENKERLKKFFKGSTEFLINYCKPQLCPVIIHADYRTGNLMYKIKKDGSYDIAVFDFQLIQVGCPIIDLMYFIFTGTDKDFRNQYYEKLIKHYYMHMRNALQSYNISPDVVYSREDFELEYRQTLPFGLMMASMVLPLVTVDPSNAPSVGDKMDITDFVVKRSPLFVARFNDVVDDFVKWGVL